MANWRPERAEKITIELKGRQAQIYAAIDFGTTFCSLGYSLGGDEVFNLDISPAKTRVPTAILLEILGGGGCATQSIGYIAQEDMISLPSEDHLKYHYFEFFKMQLHSEVMHLSRSRPTPQ